MNDNDIKEVDPKYSLKGTMPNANQCGNSYSVETAKSKINRLMVRNEQALKYLTTIRNMLPHELSFDQEEAMSWLLETKLNN